MGLREIPGSVSTAAQDRLQPWQAVFAIFTYAITQLDLSETNILILVGMISTTLGFVMRSTYKHKEAVKSVVAPWLLQQVVKILKDYLPSEEPEPSEPYTILQPTVEELEEQLRELLAKETEAS